MRRTAVGDMVSAPMKLLRKEQSLVLWCFSASLLLSSCGGVGPECNSLDTRNSVVKIVSDDNNNKLVNYAVKNSSSVAAMVGDTKSEAEKLAIWEKARQGALYRLDDTVLVNSRNRAAQEVTCIGLLYVTVADATAQKELESKVKQTADGKIIVSVSPFFVLRFYSFESSVVMLRRMHRRTSLGEYTNLPFPIRMKRSFALAGQPAFAG
jgi:hypothetical protein